MRLLSFILTVMLLCARLCAQAPLNNIQTLPSWVGVHDAGTTGASSGTTQIVTTPSESGSARQFSVQFTENGGERFSTVVGSDTQSTHFIYDVDILIPDPTDVASIEMDFNQVLANGNTVIYGVQCDGWNGVWDVTANVATIAKPNDIWVDTSARCPAPIKWAPNVWHHVELSYSRDESGNVTYEYVSWDGVKQTLALTVPSEFGLHWATVLLTNFQIDGLDNFGGGGSANVFVDNMTIQSFEPPPPPTSLTGTVVN